MKKVIWAALFTLALWLGCGCDSDGWYVDYYYPYYVTCDVVCDGWSCWDVCY
jgi:hypothetical protein